VFYNGNVTAIRFRAANIGDNVHSLFASLAPVVTFMNFRVPPFNWTNTVDDYVQVDKRIPGDVNCDGYVNEVDAGLIADIISNGVPSGTLSAEALRSANTDRVGNITIDDLYLILDVLAGIKTNF
jgi:hypothetical protein